MIANVNGTTLYYEKSGAGCPLILLHGNGETHEIFDKTIPLLQPYFTVYAVDLRGHGQSGAVAAYHYADMAADVRAFIQALALERPVLYGFSDGGIVGLLLACAEPALLSQLIVSGANTAPDGTQRGWLTLFRMIYRLTKDPKMKMMLEEPCITAAMLAQIVTPTVVLAGSRDMIKRQHTGQLAAKIRHSSLHILRGEGHGSYIVHSPKLGRLLLKLTNRQ